MPNWTTNSDVLDRWLAPDEPDDDNALTVKIGSAERAIRKAFPTMAIRLAATGEDGEPVEPDLKESIADVVYDLLVGAYTNPTHTRTTQQSTGPFSESTTHGGENPGRLVLTDDQRALLAPPAATTSRLKTIDLAAGSWAINKQAAPTQWPWYW